MSRIRSQLDTILTGRAEHEELDDRRAPQPAYPGKPGRYPDPTGPNSQGPDSEGPDSENHERAKRHEQPPQRYSARQDGRPSGGETRREPGSARPLRPAQPGKHDLENIRNSLRQLTTRLSALPENPPRRPLPGQDGGDLVALREAAVKEIRAGFRETRQELQETLRAETDELDIELRRIAETLARFEEGRLDTPPEFAELRDDLKNLQAGLDQVLRQSESPPDLSDVSNSIEAGYREIAGRLDGYLADTRAGEATQNHKYERHFEALGERLEEVSRALVSLSVSADHGGETDTLERIEARLSGLVKSVDGLDHLTQSVDRLAGHADDEKSALKAIGDELARLAERLDDTSPINAVGERLSQDFETLAGQLGSLQNDVGILAQSIERSPAFSAEFDSAFLANIENHLGRLTERVETLSLQSSGELPGEAGNEIMAGLRDIVERIDKFDPAAGAIGEDRFSALETQLGTIAGQLGTLNGGDFGPIAERLDNIEGQIAASRDIVIEIASEAARKAGMEGTSGDQETALAAVLEELRRLREDRPGEAVEAAAEGQLAEINAALTALNEKLDGFDHAAAGTPEASEPRERGETGGPTSWIADQPERDRQGQVEDFPLLDPAPSLDSTDIEPLESHADDGALVGAATAAERDATDVTALPASKANGPDETDAPETIGLEPEDVPLAPGSGMPDLEALVRRATKHKMERPDKDDEEAGISDLMAAARRAAQAASAKSCGEEEQATNENGGRSRRLLRMPSRKILLFCVLVVALTIGGLVVAPRLLAVGDSAVRGDVSALEAPDAPSIDKEADKENDTELSAVEGGQAADPLPSAAGSADEDRTADEERAADKDITGEGTDAEIVDVPDAVPENAALVDPERSTVPAMADSSDNAEQTAPPEPGQIVMASDAALETSKAVTEAETEIPGETAMAMPGELPPAEAGNMALRQAAAEGNGDALFEIGRRYTDGDGVERSLENAVPWYRRGAEIGHGPSQYRLANFYEKGHGVEQDPAMAAKWYGRAAEQGNALAMHNLAVLNAMGVVDGDADMAKAIEWFTRAAETGVKDSQVNLGVLYTKGMGVEEDLERAYKWFAIAARGGDADAAKKRDTVAQAMDADQLERARGAVELWKPEPLDRDANVAKIEDAWKTGNGDRAAVSGNAEMVRRAQELLIRAGFDPGPADGLMGAKTRQAIGAFQSANGLPINGDVSPALIEALSGTTI